MDSHVPGRGGPTAHDAKREEHEYRASAFALQQLVFGRALLVMAGMAFVRSFQAGIEGRSAVTLALRIASTSLCLLLYTHVRAGARQRSAMVLAMVLVSGLTVVAHAAEHLDRRSEELHELTVLYLACYFLLVPLFPWRLVAPCVGGICIMQSLLFLREAGRVRLGQELVKGVALNCYGAAMAWAAERHHRANFVLARRFKDETSQHRLAVVGVQRLLMNTLPAPVVREIASGIREIAHRYEYVTVLQADIVGFTPLSAARGPSEVLAILGELFEEFDEQTEVHGVHKLKTIGDAYIVCCGAFGEAEGEDEEEEEVGLVEPASLPAPLREALRQEQSVAAARKSKVSAKLAKKMGTNEAVDAYSKSVADTERRRRLTARRVVRMGLAMQEVVQAKAEEHGVELGVRIGVHTGKVMGGIIGTVRFHFDMWGNGVVGASRMEELGASGKVHVSITTANLLAGIFPLRMAHEYDEEFEHLYGIKSSYFVGETEEESHSPSLRESVKAFDESYRTRDRRPAWSNAPGTALEVNSGESELTAADVAKNMGRFMSAMRSDVAGEGAVEAGRENDERDATVASDGVPAAGRATRFSRSKTVTKLRALVENSSSAKRPMNKKAFEGRIRLNKWNMERRVSLRSGGRENTASRNLRDSFVFVNDEACDDRRRGSDALSSGTDAEVAKDMLRRQHRADDEHKEFTLHLSDARSFGMRCCEALLGLVAYLGAYDAISNFHSFGVSASESGSGGGLPPQLERVLATRYAAMLLPLLLLRIAMRVYEPRSLRYTQLTAALFASLPAAALAGMFLCIGSEILPCVEAASSTGREGVSSALPPPCGIVTPNASRSCAIGEHGGAEYCARAPLDYATTMLVLHSFLPYSFVFARQNVLIAGACISTLAGALGFAISIWVIHPEVTRAPIPPFDVLVMAVFVIFGHLIGLAHQAARHTDVWEKSALRLRQARLLRSVQEETEHCERLLNNILPPHLVSTLGPQFLIAHQQGGAGAAQVPAPPPATEGDGTRQSVALGRGVLVCESYENCSFLFAKISGLAQLVNDEARAPTEIMRALQAIFDRFDALADMYGVQKVRKTANEFYLVAAGLPNQEILPTAEDRACGIVAYGFAMVTIMHMLNLELKKHDVEFSVQVGIHSGSAIAGIIGHKTVQYDLCGDAVNTAARMCSASLPDHVHVSEATYELVRHRFGAVCRGEKDIKGKGRMKTYFLVNLPPVATEVTLGHQSMPSSPSLKSFAGREDAEEDSDNEGEWQRNVRTSLILSA